MLLRIQLALFVVVSAIRGDEDDFFSVLNNLQNNVNTEAIVFQTLTNFLRTQDLHLDKIKRYVDTFKDFQRLAGHQLNELISDPVSTYLLMRRLVVDWKEISTLLTETSAESALRTLSHFMQNSSEATEEDLNNAAMAVIRLQDVYNLNISDILKGKIGITDIGISLTANDCLRLCQQALVSMDLNLALAWFEQGLKIATENKNINSFETVTKYIQNIDQLKSLLKTSLELATPEMMQTLASIPGIPAELLHNLTKKDNVPTSEDIIHNVYKQLCRGDKLELPKPDVHFDCIYVAHDITGDLQRIKVEYLSYQPLIVMLRDIITETEVEVIKDLASPVLEPTQVHKYDNTNDIRTSPVRTGKAMWLPRKSHKLITNIYQRIEDITGLSTKNAEHMHVVNYGIGGHYEVHIDFFDHFSKGETSEYGDRMATVLFYLSDVPAGGATVFPHLLLSVKPEKGSALLWFNLLRNGKGDFRTIHAACPVLKGEKWVGNIWILDRDQALHRPCSLNEEE